MAVDIKNQGKLKVARTIYMSGGHTLEEIAELGKTQSLSSHNTSETS